MNPDVQFRCGSYIVNLTIVDQAIRFDRYYKGERSSEITHWFDDRKDDPFKIHEINLFIMARQIFWGCHGRAASSVELVEIKRHIRPAIAKWMEVVWPINTPS